MPGLIILCMTHTARLISTARRAAVVAAAGVAAVSLAGLGVGAAHAAVGDEVPDSCMKFSQDKGAHWIDQDALAYDTTINPIPGDFAKHAAFQVKNTCDTPAKFQVMTGFWDVEGNGSAQLRADINGKTGTPVTIKGKSTVETDAKLVGETGRLTKDKAVSVDLYIGLPSGETAQGFKIDPGWGFFLTEVAPGAPVDPSTPGTGGSLDTGSLGSGSLSGSLGSGSLGSGSLGKGKVSKTQLTKAGFAKSHPVVANAR